MIELDNVSKYFGETSAVDKISLAVNEGETLVLLGPSGCGKTTTLRMINRLIDPTEGTIKVNGIDITSQRPEILRRNIGYVLQHHGLFPHYTIAENIEVVPSLMHWKKPDKEKRTRELLDKMHLPYNEFASLYPRQLSGGQQQRVGVARAMAAFPPVLLMDEPFGALDPVTRSEIRKHLMQLDEFTQKTIIMVTHDIQEAFAFGDRVCIMYNGKIAQLGKPEELLFNPSNEFVSAFLGDQRMQLELKSIRVNSLWNYLPALPGDKTSDPFFVGSEASIWEVLDQLTARRGPVYVRNKAGNESRQVQPDSLFRAYSLYKA